MVTETMTYEEIAQEMINDLQGIVKYKRKERAKILRKKVLSQLNSERLVRIPPYHFHSNSSGLNYCLILYSMGRKDYNARKEACSIISYFYKDYGLYAFMLLGTIKPCLAVYTPHFFDRYRERFLKDKTISKVKAMEDFFLYNANAGAVFPKDSKYENAIFARGKDGIMLGNRYSELILEFKTFLTFEDLKEGQIDLSDKSLKILHKLMLDNYGNELLMKENRF